MIKKIVMPSGGQTTDKSMVADWFVAIGDEVKRGDVMLEIETDKATLPVESFTKGIVIDILVPSGEYASAGDALALVGNSADLAQYNKEENIPSESTEAEADDEYKPIMKGSKPVVQEKKETVCKNSEIKAMPNAKKYARENKIDLNDFADKHGLNVIKLSDLKKYLEDMKSKQEETPEAEYTDIPHSNMRRTIAKRMLESVQNIPVFQIVVDVDMTSCIALRKQMNSLNPETKISYNDIIMKAMGAAAKKHPEVNSSWREDAVRRYSQVNIGLAVSIEGGLVVPVVKNVGVLTVSEISAASREKVKKAREGKLLPEEMSGGTITLSNLGMYPLKNFTAVINPPEACILALGAIEDRTCVADGEMHILPAMTVTATFDHRIIDGAKGAEYLKELKLLLENPALIIW